jgi:hypothetical protein
MTELTADTVRGKFDFETMMKTATEAISVPGPLTVHQAAALFREVVALRTLQVLGYSGSPQLVTHARALVQALLSTAGEPLAPGTSRGSGTSAQGTASDSEPPYSVIVARVDRELIPRESAEYRPHHGQTGVCGRLDSESEWMTRVKDWLSIGVYLVRGSELASSSRTVDRARRLQLPRDLPSGGEGIGSALYQSQARVVVVGAGGVKCECRVCCKGLHICLSRLAVVVTMCEVTLRLLCGDVPSWSVPAAHDAVDFILDNVFPRRIDVLCLTHSQFDSATFRQPLPLELATFRRMLEVAQGRICTGVVGGNAIGDSNTFQTEDRDEGYYFGDFDGPSADDMYGSSDSDDASDSFKVQLLRSVSQLNSISSALSSLLGAVASSRLEDHGSCTTGPGASPVDAADLLLLAAARGYRPRHVTELVSTLSERARFAGKVWAVAESTKPLIVSGLTHLFHVVLQVTGLVTVLQTLHFPSTDRGDPETAMVIAESSLPVCVGVGSSNSSVGTASIATLSTLRFIKQFNLESFIETCASFFRSEALSALSSGIVAAHYHMVSESVPDSCRPFQLSDANSILRTASCCADQVTVHVALASPYLVLFSQYPAVAEVVVVKASAAVRRFFNSCNSGGGSGMPVPVLRVDDPSMSQRPASAPLPAARTITPELGGHHPSRRHAQVTGSRRRVGVSPSSPRNHVAGSGRGGASTLSPRNRVSGALAVAAPTPSATSIGTASQARVVLPPAGRIAASAGGSSAAHSRLTRGSGITVSAYLERLQAIVARGPAASMSTLSIPNKGNTCFIGTFLQVRHS